MKPNMGKLFFIHIKIILVKIFLNYFLEVKFLKFSITQRNFSKVSFIILILQDVQ